MLHAHRGALDTAVPAFREARWVGREQGDRLAEFFAVEQWAMLEIDRDRHDDALALTQELVALGERVRAGAESACARALFALAKSRQGAPAAADSAGIRRGLDAAVAELRDADADAKYELAFVLTRRARHEVAAGEFRTARDHAGEGLQSALAIGRASEIALAHALLARCARETGESETAARHTRALDELGPDDLAAPIRDRLRELLPPGDTAARRARKR